MVLLLLLLASTIFPTVESRDTVVPAADGVPIHYSVQGKGEPTLVFIHCWSCDGRLWENQVSAFAKGHRVVTIDLPGHGESGQGRKTWSIESYGDDVKRVVTKLDLKQVVLIGSSMGGPVALEATRLMPERVVAIVPVDTLHNVEWRLPAEQVEGLLKQIRADYKGALTELMNEWFFSKSTPESVRKRVISEATSRPPELAIAILEAVIAHDPIPAMREIKVPIKAINADLNPTNLESNRKYAQKFDVVIMKGVGHYPMLEDPVRFNQLLTDVLQSLK